MELKVDMVSSLPLLVCAFHLLFKLTHAADVVISCNHQGDVDEMRVVAFISNPLVEEGVEVVLAVAEQDHMEVMGPQVCVYVSLCVLLVHILSNSNRVTRMFLTLFVHRGWIARC